MAKQVYKIPDTINLETLKALEGTDGTRVNIVVDADGNNVLSEEIVNSKEFKETKNAILLAGHLFTKIDYKPKDYPIGPEEK